MIYASHILKTSIDKVMQVTVDNYHVAMWKHYKINKK